MLRLWTSPQTRTHTSHLFSKRFHFGLGLGPGFVDDHPPGFLDLGQLSPKLRFPGVDRTFHRFSILLRFPRGVSRLSDLRQEGIGGQASGLTMFSAASAIERGANPAAGQ